LILVAIVIAIAVFSTIISNSGGAKAPPKSAASVSPTTAASTVAASGSTASATPLVVPTAAIALPACPAQSVPQVDNPARYGFCVPPGWAAFNSNNADPVTQIFKPYPGDPNPVILQTDFTRIQIVIALNTAAPTNPPADCLGAPNDTIAGFPVHHCTAALDATQNPYHANEAQYWRIELPQGKSFYITSLSANAAQADLTSLSGIVHLVKPLGNR